MRPIFFPAISFAGFWISDPRPAMEKKAGSNGGFGKTRFDGSQNNTFETGGYARAMLVWRPHLTWSWDMYLSLQGDTQAQPSLDLVEGYVSYRGAPTDGWRLSGRLGLMYPPVSLENDGPGWTTTRTITPSAINSWIGEEVKIGGVEVTARRQFGDSDLTLTLAAFGWNDTSGTLLAARGWALDDVLVGANGRLDLPDRSFSYQDFTNPPTSWIIASAIMGASPTIRSMR